MNKILTIREKIYNYFHSNKKCQKYFFSPERSKEYSIYYTSMYQIQDTAEALMEHRKKGFTRPSLIAYIEFWGLMQAIIIQQDSIKQLYKLFTFKSLKIDRNSQWKNIRELRNLCAGHPINKSKDSDNKDIPPKRTFMGRNFGDYNCMIYEQFDESTGQFTHPKIFLGKIIDQYEIEAESILQNTLETLAIKFNTNTSINSNETL